MNNVNLSGRITKDLELKMTKADTPMLQFTLACKRKLSNNDGEKLTDFFNCVAFGPRAVFLSKYACKSTMIGIEGRLQSKVYIDDNNVRHQTVDVICESVEIFRMPKESNTQVETKVQESKHNLEEETKDTEFSDLMSVYPSSNTNIEQTVNEAKTEETEEDLDDFNRMMNNFSSFFE